MIKTPFLLLCIALLLFAEKAPVAVLDFEAISVEKEDVITLSNKLRSELVKNGELYILSRNEMKNILEEQEFQGLSYVSKAGAIKIGQLMGVSYIVTGTISKISDLYYVNAVLINIETSEIEMSVDETTQADITELLFTAMPAIAKQISSYRFPSETKIALPYDSKEVSPPEVITKAVGLSIGALGVIGGTIKNSEAQRAHSEYMEIEGYDKQDELNSKRDTIKNAEKQRNIFFVLGGAGFSLTIVSFFF